VVRSQSQPSSLSSTLTSVLPLHVRVPSPTVELLVMANAS
jgi:hypothetical protein